MILATVLTVLVVWWFVRRRHRTLTEHQSNVVASQPLTEWSARFPRTPKGRVQRKGWQRGGF
jgi:hypothetical protein